MAKQRRKLPAGNFVPGIDGWLCHVVFGWYTSGYNRYWLQQLQFQPDQLLPLGYLSCSYGRSQTIRVTVREKRCVLAPYEGLSLSPRPCNQKYKAQVVYFLLFNIK